MKTRRATELSSARSEEPWMDPAELLLALQTVRDGDFSARLPSDRMGLAGKVADTFNQIVAANDSGNGDRQRRPVGKDHRRGPAGGRATVEFSP